jgi:hypothetical protein
MITRCHVTELRVVSTATGALALPAANAITPSSSCPSSETTLQRTV